MLGFPLVPPILVVFPQHLQSGLVGSSFSSGPHHQCNQPQKNWFFDVIISINIGEGFDAINPNQNPFSMQSTKIRIQFRCRQPKSEQIFDAVNPNQNTFSMSSTQIRTQFRCSQPKSEPSFDAVNPNQNTFSMSSTQIGMNFRCCHPTSGWFFDAVNPLGQRFSMYPMMAEVSHKCFRCRTGKHVGLKTLFDAAVANDSIENPSLEIFCLCWRV